MAAVVDRPDRVLVRDGSGFHRMTLGAAHGVLIGASRNALELADGGPANCRLREKPGARGAPRTDRRAGAQRSVARPVVDLSSSAAIASAAASRLDAPPSPVLLGPRRPFALFGSCVGALARPNVMTTLRPPCHPINSNTPHALAC